MERIGIRELRNRVSEVIRRVHGGERIIITSNDLPVAELGPVTGGRTNTIEDLAEAGLIRLPRSQNRRPAPPPVKARNGVRIIEVLEDLRSR
ncbi:MAG: type II toxin-antitoxin system Phd/YefM family antitoxin [Acidimicrobiia bacterium]